jgi:uncharacterized protein involved in exopolysaccharide biosynthesis
MDGKRVGLLALVLASALVAAGCGGDDESGAESWANDVCTNLSEWITEVDEAVRSVTDEGLSIDEATLRDVLEQTEEATDELVDDLRELGAPETDSGQQAREEVAALGTDLQEQFATVEEALDGNQQPLELVSTVAEAVSASVNRLQASLQELQSLDPGGELEEAFRDSDDCNDLREQVEAI